MRYRTLADVDDWVSLLSALVGPFVSRAEVNLKRGMSFADTLAAGASIVGVNARDLGTFGEDLGLSERLAGRIPGEVTAVAESAIRAPADAERMAEAGYDAVLVGEALVRSDDPTQLVDAMSRHSVRTRR